MRKRKKIDAGVRFWKHVNKTETCWVWTGATYPWGYGSFGISTGKSVRAHRFAYELFFGKIPNGKHLLHSCDNPPCVNPAHLTVGTDADNRKDCCLKGRAAHSSLDAEQVKEIRKLRKEGYLLRELSDIFGVTLQNIHYIIRGKIWTHV